MISSDLVTLALLIDEGKQEPKVPIRVDAQVKHKLAEQITGDASVKHQGEEPTSGTESHPDDARMEQHNDQPTSGAGLTSQVYRREDEQEPQEYEVQNIVDHVKADGGTLYRVRWYEFRSQDDTWESAANIPHHFIARYYRHV